MGSDMVNHPDHYTSGGIECIEALDAMPRSISAAADYARRTAVKYLWRAPLKGNERQDLEKARWYVDHAIAAIDGAQGDIRADEAQAGAMSDEVIAAFAKVVNRDGGRIYGA